MKSIIQRALGILGVSVIRRQTFDAIVQAQTTKLVQHRPSVKLNSVNAARFLYLHELYLMTKDLPGDVVECGVGHGRSFTMLCLLMRHLGGGGHLWGFDSFEGFPDPSEFDGGGIRKPVTRGQYSVPLEEVEAILQNSLEDIFLRQRVTLVKGFFDATLDEPNLRQIRLLNLDVDLYDSYKTCLETLYPKLVVGGIVTFDEYVREATRFPGAKKAIDEFFDGKEADFRRDPFYGKYYAVKLG